MNNALLDKGVIRKLIEAFINVSLENQLTIEQEQVAKAFRHVVLRGIPFITIETYHILRSKFLHLPFYDLLNELTNVVIPVRYTRRWARRLRAIGFSREDAWQLAMATFCSDKALAGICRSSENKSELSDNRPIIISDGPRSISLICPVIPTPQRNSSPKQGYLDERNN